MDDLRTAAGDHQRSSNRPGSRSLLLEEVKELLAAENGRVGRTSSALVLFQPLQPNAVVIDSFDGAVQLPLDPAEAVGMLIQDTAVFTELRLNSIKPATDPPKSLPHLFVQGLKPVRHRRGKLINSYSVPRHRSPHSHTGAWAVN
jgi:hypothetical protein